MEYFLPNGSVYIFTVLIWLVPDKKKKKTTQVLIIVNKIYVLDWTRRFTYDLCVCVRAKLFTKNAHFTGRVTYFRKTISAFNNCKRTSFVLIPTVDRR